MHIPAFPLTLFALSFVFFLMGLDPKSRYGLLGILILLGAVVCFFVYPELPLVARH